MLQIIIVESYLYWSMGLLITPHWILASTPVVFNDVYPYAHTYAPIHQCRCAFCAGWARVPEAGCSGRRWARSIAPCTHGEIGVVPVCSRCPQTHRQRPLFICLGGRLAPLNKAAITWPARLFGRWKVCVCAFASSLVVFRPWQMK